MSRSLNQVTLLGNVGNDPEVKRFGQRAVANFSLATSESWKDKTTGEWKESTQWHRISVWSPIAEVVEKYVKKGSKVLVQGKVKYRSWQDRDGATRYSTEIEVREVILLDKKERVEDGAPVPQANAGKTAEQNRDPNDFKDFPEALDAEDDDLPF